VMSMAGQGGHAAVSLSNLSDPRLQNLAAAGLAMRPGFAGAMLNGNAASSVNGLPVNAAGQLSLQAAAAVAANQTAYATGALPAAALARDPTTAATAALADPYLGQSIGPVPGYGTAFYRGIQRYTPY